ncbi:MAG: response regulator transcription factor [Bacteroidetes bacterium]|nr:response regulator transcription factor [Bacteroidota bacterium]
MDKSLKMEKKLSVLVVDDHPLYRNGIRRILGNIEFIKRCDEAENGQDALNKIEKHRYNIILLDLQMPVMDGVEAAKQIINHYPDCKIIILTMSDSKRQMIELLDLGVTGYVLKSTDEYELTDAIMRVSEGGQYLSKEVDAAWTQFLGNKLRFELDNQKAVKVELSDREKEIIRMICKQLSTQEIADALSLSNNTVKTHRNHIMRKLGVDNVVGIAIYAVRAGIFVP